MCGINGLYHKKNINKEMSINIINNMNSYILHRGPDEEGIFIDENIALGMRRLSVIDLETGSQPIYNENKTKVIVFNGEIYNYKELKKDLLDKGHIFKTKGDTETVLHLYEEYGTECLNKLDGMFAFCIYDILDKSILIARDISGEKPLYYFMDREKFAFSSELKSIINTYNVKKEINIEALNQYFSLTYIPAPLTIFKEIYKLEAGSYIIYKDGIIKTEKYWNIKSMQDGFIYDYNTLKKNLREALIESVKKKMVSDVPIGAFLSGGIDSGIIVGIMQSLSSKPIETFSMGFKIKEFDESGRAEIIAKKNKTSHHKHYLDYNDAIDELDTILDTFDEPFADSSCIPTYFVSKFAKEYVTVALTGDGGDELFGGYSKYLINYYSDLYNKVPGIIRKNIFEKLLYALPDSHSITRKARKVVENRAEDGFARRKNLMFLGYKKDELGMLLKPEYFRENHDNFIEKIYKSKSDFDELTKTLYTDFKIVLEGDMLTKVDRMSMLNSLETRIPMLDKRVIELAFKIPPQFKIKGINQKYILKDAFSELIPKEVLRGPKQGFRAPVGEWFRGSLKNKFLKLLDKEFIEEQGIFDYEYIMKIYNEHLKQTNNHDSRLWAVLVFLYWYKKYY